MAANLQDFAPRMSVQEYLDTEPLSEVKREYLDGMVVAMAGASDRHGLICGFGRNFVAAGAQGGLPVVHRRYEGAGAGAARHLLL